MLYITFVELIYLLTESLYLLTTFIQLLLSLPSALVITNLISFPMHLFVCLFLKYNWTYNTMLVPVTQHAAAAAAKSLQLCPTLCDPTDGSPRGSPVPGILQARTPEWVAISFSNAWKWKVKVKSLSRVWLLATPWTEAHQAPPSMGFARQEYWSGVLLPSPDWLLLHDAFSRNFKHVSQWWFYFWLSALHLIIFVAWDKDLFVQ